MSLGTGHTLRKEFTAYRAQPAAPGMAAAATVQLLAPRLCGAWSRATVRAQAAASGRRAAGFWAAAKDREREEFIAADLVVDAAIGRGTTARFG